MEKILILHGPNLNLLGEREPDIYGNLTLDEIDKRLVQEGLKYEFEVHTKQSNHEGELIDALQDARQWASGVIFNPGGYTHTSVALRDAIAAVGISVIEVHISNIFAREVFRRTSMISPVCKGTITGFGWNSYKLGMQALFLEFEAQE